MCTKPYHISGSLVKVYRDHQSEIVALNIEDNAIISYYACIAIGRL